MVSTYHVIDMGEPWGRILRVVYGEGDHLFCWVDITTEAAARAAHTAQADAHALQGLRHHLLIWRCQSCCLFRTLQISLIWRYRPGCLLWTRQISCVLALPAHGHPDCLIRTWRISRSCCLGMADEGAPEYMIRT